MTKPALIDFQLQGRRALVTGSASGIGLATAVRVQLDMEADSRFL